MASLLAKSVGQVFNSSLLLRKRVGEHPDCTILLHEAGEVRRFELSLTKLHRHSQYSNLIAFLQEHMSYSNAVL